MRAGIDVCRVGAAGCGATCTVVPEACTGSAAGSAEMPAAPLRCCTPVSTARLDPCRGDTTAVMTVLPPEPDLRVISPASSHRLRARDVRVRSHPHFSASAVIVISTSPALRNQLSAASLSSGGMDLEVVVIEGPPWWGGPPARGSSSPCCGGGDHCCFPPRSAWAASPAPCPDRGRPRKAGVRDLEIEHGLPKRSSRAEKTPGRPATLAIT
jgi:hypothetical protein